MKKYIHFGLILIFILVVALSGCGGGNGRGGNGGGGDGGGGNGGGGNPPYIPTITTIAGNGTPGYSGDGGPATSAQLYNPSGVAVDSVGSIYIADTLNHCIRKVDSSGNITTFAGTPETPGFGGDGGPATSTQLNWPYGVAVDSDGNIYIADNNNYRVRKVDSSGKITTFAGTGTAGYSGDGGPATLAQLNWPYGVAVDSVGNIYITDRGNNRIRKVK